jgi:hypothetical protein
VNGEAVLAAQDIDPSGVGRANRPGLFAQGGAGFRVTFRSIEIELLS